ncbi:hypothetical protein SBBP2_2530002 [Burkholderiales bacterium]|nr:hypothetical protein SBBP2_2530002 [Burkholderiales bacterium]
MSRLPRYGVGRRSVALCQSELKALIGDMTPPRCAPSYIERRRIMPARPSPMLACRATGINYQKKGLKRLLNEVLYGSRSRKN